MALYALKLASFLAIVRAAASARSDAATTSALAAVTASAVKRDSAARAASSSASSGKLGLPARARNASSGTRGLAVLATRRLGASRLAARGISCAPSKGEALSDAAAGRGGEPGGRVAAGGGEASGGGAALASAIAAGAELPGLWPAGQPSGSSGQLERLLDDDPLLDDEPLSRPDDRPTEPLLERRGLLRGVAVAGWSAAKPSAAPAPVPPPLVQARSVPPSAEAPEGGLECPAAPEVLRSHRSICCATAPSSGRAS